MPFYRRAYGAIHHIIHGVQLNLLCETDSTRSVKHISFVLRYAVQLKTGDFHSGSHIKKRNLVDTALGLLE
jgi:hypothetical protein